MELASFLYALALALFIFLSVITAKDFVRFRDQMHLYTMLLLSTLTLNLLLGLVGQQSLFNEIFGVVQWLSLLAHPFIFLLLLKQFRAVPPWIFSLAVVGLLYSYTLVLFSLPDTSLWIILPVPAYFIMIETYAISTVWYGAKRAQGVTRPRLILIAVASSLLNLIIILFALSLFWIQIQSELDIVILFLAILVALGYFLGFAPPVWLNRMWQLSEVHSFLEKVAVHPPEERALEVTRLLRQTAMRMVEATEVVVACWADRNELLMIEGSSELLDLVRGLNNREGLIGHVWESKQSLVSVGLQGMAEVEGQTMQELKANSVMVIPVMTSKRVWGVVMAFLVRRPIFETDDISLLTLLAQQMANILSYTALLADQHVLIDKLNRREAALRVAHKQTQMVAHIATQLNDHLGLEESLKEICQTVAQVFNVPVVTISLYDEAGKVLYLAYDFGLSDAARQQMQAFPRELHDAYAQLAGPVHIVPDVQQLADLPNRELYARMNLRTTVNATMWYGNLLIGRLNIGTLINTREFSEQELTLLKGIANQAAIAIHRVSLYQQVQDHAAQLEQRVHERTIELQARNRELDAFAHMAAHDLKSPLALIIGFASLLIDDWSQLPPDEVQKLLNYVVHSSNKMVAIVDELLLFASIRQEEVAFERLDMAQIVADVQMRLAYMVQEHRATIVLPDLWPEAVGYAPWLEEVWMNYISNAIKYGGNPPCIKLGADAQANGMVRFWVRDNGVGIPADEQEHLFEPFTQLSGQSNKSGHGLGLSIVERIIIKLGGEVGCVSQDGEGSLFYFTLPYDLNHSF